VVHQPTHNPDPIGTNQEQQNSVDHGSGSETLAELDDLHLYGDIVQLILTTPDIRRTPYITLSGATFNKTDNSFDINAAQYTSFYKAQRNLSMLPIRAHFDEVRYKKKKPLPANNTYVVVDGFLNDVDMTLTLGYLPSSTSTSTISVSLERLFYRLSDRVEIKPHLLPRARQGSNSALIHLHILHPFLECRRHQVLYLLPKLKILARDRSAHVQTR